MNDPHRALKEHRHLSLKLTGQRFAMQVSPEGYSWLVSVPTVIDDLGFTHDGTLENLIVRALE